MPPLLMGLLFALLFAVPAAILSVIGREEDRGAVAAGNFVPGLIILWPTFSIVFYKAMPAMSVPTMIFWILIGLLVVSFVSSIVDLFAEARGLMTIVGWSLVVLVTIVGFIGHNSGHDANKASSLVTVNESTSALPASNTEHMVMVTSAFAAVKASQAMSAGESSSRNYNTYLDPGNGTLQFVNGKMWYVFPLKFDGSGNKKRLQGVEPGYLMVSAEDPSAEVVEKYDGDNTMIVCAGCGQQAEPTRWAYSHGYRNVLDDPTLELDDSGHPYWTMTIDKPRLGWTFYAPTSLLVIDAHTGAITEYPLDKTAPAWVDRIYSQQEAKDIVGWYGDYKNAGFKTFGSSNANRLQVSGDPVLVYTGDGHPDWRILLTSHNADSAVSKIVIMNAHTGAMTVTTPSGPMGIEAPVADAFNSASGQGAGSVKASHIHVAELTLHVIYGRLTWMALYVPEGDHPSYVGVGFLDAYNASASNAVFGNSRSAALMNYRAQLSISGSSNGNDPSAGGQDQTTTGKIADLGWNVTGGEKYFYFTLVGDRTHVYVGTVSAVGPAITIAAPGDTITVTFQDIGEAESTRTMKSFVDSAVPLTKAGA